MVWDGHVWAFFDWGAFVALHFGFWVGLLWEFGAGGVICIGCFAGVINGMFCSPAFFLRTKC